MESVGIKAYKCSKCGGAYLSKDMADKCCETKYCKDCGKELPYKWYKTVCLSCSDKREYDRATKISYNDYIVQHKDDYYTLCIGDKFYADIDDLFDSLDEDEFEEIEYCNGTYKDRMELDYESIIDEMIEESDMDEFEVDKSGYDELKQFLIGWNKKYGTDRYSCDDKVIVLIDKSLKEEHHA
jgi:hypothetical protein